MRKQTEETSVQQPLTEQVLPVLPQEEILRGRELQVKHLSLQNRLFALNAEFQEITKRATTTQEELKQWFKQAEAMLGEGYQLDAETMKAVAVEQKVNGKTS